jgi:hypothetical protein
MKIKFFYHRVARHWKHNAATFYTDNRSAESSWELPRRRLRSSRFFLTVCHYKPRTQQIQLRHENLFIFFQKKNEAVWYAGGDLHVAYTRIPYRIECAGSETRTLETGVFTAKVGSKECTARDILSVIMSTFTIF